jgi:flavodoxin I
MKTLGIIYWPKKGSVELNAKRIHREWGEDTADLISLRDIEPEGLLDYSYLIFGCSTVGADSWRDAYTGNPWNTFLLKMNRSSIDLRGRKVALFGLGDQILYPDHYVDEMARISSELKAHGAVIVGLWPADGYEHTDSKALKDGYFLGLALDEHNQANLSMERIHTWIGELKKNHFF